MGAADSKRIPSAPEPYRGATDRSVRDRPPPELVYAPVHATGGREGIIVLYRLFWLPITLGSVGAFVGGASGALVGLVGGALSGLRSWRSRSRASQGLLRVENDVLSVSVRRPRASGGRLDLRDLANVTLDVRSIERVMDGGSAIPVMRFVDPIVGPKLDTARIVLVDVHGREMRLSDEYLSHLEATEWLGKIRVFLRKHGWVPEDERPDAGADRITANPADDE